MAMGWFKVSGWLQLLRLGFGSLLLSILGLSLVAPKAAEAQELQAELPFPSYSFSFPRLAYDVETDEVLVGNGSISAAMVSNGNDSYFASQLRRIHAPPFTLNNADQGTLVIWGYDELGWHASMNKKFKLDYNIREVKAFTAEPEFYGQTNPNWLVDFSYSALPGQRVILATVNYKNISSEPHPLQLSFALINPQITKSYNWDWWNPATSKISAQFQKSGPFGFVETQSRAQDAYLVFGLDKTVDSKAVTTQNEWQRWVDTGSYSGLNFVKNVKEHNQYLAHSFGLVQAGQTVSVTGIISIDGSASGAREHFLNAAGDLPKQLDGAESYWRQRWNNTKFEVLSPDDGINRMADLAMSNGIGAWDEINDSWVTAFSENARGANYLWDNNYAGYGFLFSNPPRVKSTLRKLLNLNWKTKYAYSIADGHSVGTYYAYNHNTLVELVYRYVLTSGDLAFLSERIQGQSVFDILLENLDYVDSSLNYNFGEMSNLLEVIPNYIHGVPDLIAATYKMAKEIEAMALELGQTQQANRVALIAERAKQKTQELWVPEAKWFATSDGHIVYTTQIFNMIYSGALTDEQIQGILARKDDFIFAYGTRSLASYDSAWVPSNLARGDFDGPGGYVGNAGNMLRSLAAAQRKDEVYSLSQGISQWFQWRPWQPQGIEADTGKGIGSIAKNTTNTCTARYIEVVPFDMIGLVYTFKGIEIHDAFPPRWSNAIGKASFQGHRYTVKASVPYRGHKYSFYVDKPEPRDSVYRYASLYNSQGLYIKDVQAGTIPPFDEDLSIVLHFTP